MDVNRQHVRRFTSAIRRDAPDGTFIDLEHDVSGLPYLGASEVGIKGWYQAIKQVSAGPAQTLALRNVMMPTQCRISGG